MKFILFLLSIYTISVADIQITKNNSYIPTNEEIHQTKIVWESRRLKIDEEEAKKLVIENRRLANAFLDSQAMDSSIGTELKIHIEELLADRMVKEYINKTPIDDKILKSYYEDNKIDFLKPSEVKLRIFNFSTFDKAFGFYDQIQNDIKKIDSIILENNITFDVHSSVYSQLNPQIINLIGEEPKEGFIAPPQKYFSQYIVLIVDRVDPLKLDNFENVKDRIAKLLKNKVFNSKRKELLESLSSGAEDQK